MKPYTLEGIANVNDVVEFLGVSDTETFFDNVSVSYGDANYTILDTFTFWRRFLKQRARFDRQYPNGGSFVMEMEKHGIKWINLED